MKKLLQYFSNQKALISRVEKLSEEKAIAVNMLLSKHKLYISTFNGAYFLSIVDIHDNVTSILQIPALKYIQLKKAGVEVIAKNILND